MKLYTLLFVGLFVNSGWAIGAPPELNTEANKWGQLVQSAEYSAKFVGYSSYCKVGERDVDYIHNWYINIVLPKSNLSDSNLKTIKQIYYKMVATAKANGPIDSNLNCEVFKVKLDELKYAINHGGSSASNKQNASGIIMSEDIKKYIDSNKK